MIKELFEKYKRKSQLIEYFKGPKEFRKRCKVVETEDKIYCYLKGSFIRKVDNGDNYMDLRKNSDMQNIPNIDKPIIYVIEKLNKRFYNDLYIQGHADELIIKNSKLTLGEIEVLALDNIKGLIIENSVIKGENSSVIFEIIKKIIIKNSIFSIKELSLKTKEIEIQESSIESRDINISSVIFWLKDSFVMAKSIKCNVKRIITEDLLSIFNPNEKFALQVEEQAKITISASQDAEIIINGKNIEHTSGCISLDVSSNEESKKEAKVIIKPRNMVTFELGRKNTCGRVLKQF